MGERDAEELAVIPGLSDIETGSAEEIPMFRLGVNVVEPNREPIKASIAFMTVVMEMDTP